MNPETSTTRRWMLRIPATLIASRVVFGPVLIWLSVSVKSPAWIITVLILAMLSDLFDGIIARRLKIATAPLRVADSRADAWFFTCVGLSAWLAAPDVLRAYRVPILIEVGLQLATYAFDLIRYRRIASLHAYSAKVWGFTLFIAAGALLAFHNGVFIWVCFGFGMLSFVDATAIKLILPGWHHDVLSAFHALKARRAKDAVT